MISRLEIEVWMEKKRLGVVASAPEI